MWLNLIRKIKNQPYGSGLDINVSLKKSIESHFRYYWENDRREVLLDKKEYFDSIRHAAIEILAAEDLIQTSKRSKTLHLGLQLNHPRNVASMYPIVLLLTRVTFVATALLTSHLRYAGLLITLVVSLLSLLYSIHERPFNSPLFNF